MAFEVAREDISAAAGRIEELVRHTPILDLGHASSTEYSLILKLEHLQVTGSFKARGAFSLMTGRDMPDTGVTAASGGNFGIAIAHAAAQLGHTATIFVPETSPRAKIDRIGEHGADVRVIPGYYDEAAAVSTDFAAESGAFRAHAYDQLEVVAGQGTLARELEDQTDFDVILCAVGGGGLIAGIASWLRDRVRTVAVEPEECRSFNAALEAGHPVEVDVSGVAASSLGARTVGEHLWSAKGLVDDSVVVGDADIVAAQRWLWSIAKLAVEPAAAAPMAALLSGVYQPEPGSRVVVVLSGANVDPGTVD